MKAKPRKKKDAKKELEKKMIATPEEETEKPFNFGGLPLRNLKKNLGCG